ncbi:MAG: GNAT family N-acetyltransferase [Chloroflexia bacterium]|nr:GNAT family N-acetyltransferase [Chloroflexia bacterium]
MSQRPDIVSLQTERQFRAAVDSHTIIHEPTPMWVELHHEHPVWSVDGAHRAIFQGDRAIALTALGVWDHRFGATTLKAGEIGLVGTLPEHRKRGLSRLLMESWIATMREQHIPLMFLTGIPDFYEQWDFHYACPDHANAFLSIALEPLAACAIREGTLRALDPDRDAPAVVDLIAAEHRHTPCSPIIDTDLLRFFVDKADPHGVDWRVIEDGRGDICAVVRWKRWSGGIGPQPGGAVTLAAAREGAARGILAAALLDHLKRSGEAELPLAIAPHGPFGEWLFHRGARRKSASSIYRGGYAAMYRVNDLAAVLEALRTEWDESLLMGRHAGTSVALRAGRDDGQVATVSITEHGIDIAPGATEDIVSAPPAVTVPWITGWRSAGDWLDRVPYPPLRGPAVDPGNPDDVSPAVASLLRDLFPHRHPYIGDTLQGG